MLYAKDILPILAGGGVKSGAKYDDSKKPALLYLYLFYAWQGGQITRGK
jgi:hypothetical protein